MAWFSHLITIAGLILLAHAGYSAQEQHAQLTTSLPADIRAETVLATLIVVLGLVLSAPELRPIRWNVWAGKIEREGGNGSGLGANPFAGLESRRGFVDVRRGDNL